MFVFDAQDIQAFFNRISTPSSAKRDVARQYIGTKKWNEHQFGYVRESMEQAYVMFMREYPEHQDMIGFSSFKKYKPYWIRPHTWQTCKCPKCTELEEMTKIYLHQVPLWHQQDQAVSTASSRTPTVQCSHCKQFNPLSDLSLQGGLDALYRMSVCEHAVDFGTESTPECAHGVSLLHIVD